VKWLLSKAYNNRVPENLREPFYRDQEVMCVSLIYIHMQIITMKVYCKEYVSEK
jgi:hypothetical protein